MRIHSTNALEPAIPEGRRRINVARIFLDELSLT
jgi:transposase-like protein